MNALVRLIVLCALTWASLAHAAEAASDFVMRAEQAERSGDAERAIELYHSAERADPGSRWARRARIRLDWLEPRLAEAGPAAVSKLLRMRALRDSELTKARVDDLARGLDQLPFGRVRRESRALAAGAYERLGERSAALSAYRAWLADPGIDATDRRFAATGAARCQEALGDRAGALETLRRADEARTPEAWRLVLASFGFYAWPSAALVIALFVLVSAVVARRGFGRAALARAFAPARIAIALWLLCVPLLVGVAHSPEMLRAMIVVVAALAPMLAWSAVAGSALDLAGVARARRNALAMLGVLALVAGLYLALDRSGTLLELALGFQRA